VGTPPGWVYQASSECVFLLRVFWSVFFLVKACHFPFSIGYTLGWGLHGRPPIRVPVWADGGAARAPSACPSGQPLSEHLKVIFLFLFSFFLFRMFSGVILSIYPIGDRSLFSHSDTGICSNQFRRWDTTLCNPPSRVA